MKYLVYHLAAANPVRTYPPVQGAEFIRMFLDEFPDWGVKVVGLNERPERTEPDNATDEAALLMDGLEERVLVPETGCFTELFPIVRDAGLIVCPDSAVGHLAGAFPNVPVISLWGPFDPDDRAKYYRNHHPLRGEGCSEAPCRAHSFTLPVDRCIKGGCDPYQEDGKTLGWCGALASITPGMILEKAKELLSLDNDDPAVGAA